jgi:hypothetical protein
MGWDLTIEIDFSNEPLELVDALASFWEPDIESILFEVTRGGVRNEEVLMREEFDWNSSSLLKVKQLCQEGMQIGADTCVEVWFGLHGRGEFGGYSPVPDVYFFGSEYVCRGGNRNYNAFCDATLSLGNHTAYKGEYNLPVSGRCLDRILVTELLKHICYEIQPKNLYLEHEQGANVPWNHHFIFHNTLEGYAKDLADLIQLGLHGGDERYADSRQDYEASISPSQKMMFGRRNQDHIEILQNFMLKYGTQIEKNGLPQTLSRELVEDALLETSTMLDEEGKPLLDFFFVGEGLGVYAQPLLNRYSDLIFLALMTRIEGTTEALEAAATI